MQPSPLLTTLHMLLAQHRAALHDLSGDLSKAVTGVEDEKLAVCLESYFDRATDEMREVERLLQQRRIKLASAPDKALACLCAEAAAVQDLDLPGEILDVLLSRALLRIQHCQIAALGVLQALAEQLEDRDVLKLVRGALEAEIDCEETLSTLLENELVMHAAGASA